MARFIFSAFADEASPFIDEQIAACKANGITHIELRGLGNDQSINSITPDEARALKAKLDEAGIGISAIGSGYGKIEITDDFEPHFEAFKNTVEVAKILGAKNIRMFSFYFTKGESYDEYKPEVIRRLEALCDYANAHGIRCCHENECNIYGDVPERCLEIHKALGDKMGGIFDPANYIHTNTQILPAYEMLEEYIDYLHIKDARFSDGVVVPAGEGDGEITELLRRFAQKPGARFLTLEPHLKEFGGLNKLEAHGGSTALTQGVVDTQFSDNYASFKAAADALHKQVALAQPIRFGIIGVGNMGTAHTHSFADGKIKEMRLVAVADPRAERLEVCKGIHPDLATFPDGKALIDSGLCDAVIIATPHYLHPELVCYAIEKGLHVISEKPAGVYTKQVREMNEFAAKHDRAFTIMFNQRTNHVYRKMKELVQSGKYGEIRRVNWIITDWYRTQSYYNSGGWRATWKGEGGGVLLNQCPHNLDLWQWICGMPVKIRAFCHEGKWHDIEVEDDVTIYAEYANGATGLFVTTTGDAPGTNRFEITMDGAKLVCENNKLSVYELDEWTSKHCATCPEGFEKPDGHYIDIETDGLNEQHIGVLNAFASHILHGTPMVAEGAEGIRSLSISNAAHLSSWLGKEITLPVDEDLFLAELQKRIDTSVEKTNVTESAADVDMSGSFNTKG